MRAPVCSFESGFIARFFSRRALRRGWLTLAIVATAAALFYTEENWRGNRAWERFKQESARRGLAADWSAFIPPPVPDGQNFFKAPNMQQWFVGRGATDFSRRIGFQGLDEMVLRRGLVPSVDITVVSGNAPVASEAADLVLQYNSPLLSLANPPSASAARPAGNLRQRHVEISSAALGQMFQIIKPNPADFKPSGPPPKLSDVSFCPIGLQPLRVIAPRRMVVRTDDHPSADEVAGFIPANLALDSPFGYGRGVISTGSNTYRVSLGAAPYAPAADFLAWSDSLQDDFAALGAALDRPYARMDGDYEHPAAIPIPNFVCARATAQLLALRAQCYLLLGEPEKALRELTLMHHLCRMFEGRPTGRPMTLVAAMIDVAVKGLYVSIVGDGLRLRAWREPQLAAIQRQLAETDLLPYVHDAFQMESMSFGRMVETSTADELANAFHGSRDPGYWARISDPVYDFIRFAPHGWLCQNAVAGGSLKQTVLETFDPAHHLVLPKKAEANFREVERSLEHKTPYNYLVGHTVPNFSRAVQTAARNQTLLNEALVACALERYRLARGRYPEALAELVPQYAEKLPRDLIGGEALNYRGEGGQFVLYSIGWNERDDGGIPGGKGDLPGDLAKNDWVWPYQETNGK